MTVRHQDNKRVIQLVRRRLEVGRKPGGNGVEIGLDKAHVRLGGNRLENKDVISIEREVRGNREGDVSNTIDVYKKEEGAEDRTLGNPRGNK